MRSSISGGRKAILAGVLVAGSAAISGCATEDYVDKHIAAVNARIDQTDGRLGALEGRVNEVSQKADAGIAAAQAAAQSAAAAAQTAGADAARANEAIEKMEPQVAHMWSHHNRKTWADHPKKKSKKSKSKKSKK